MSKWIRQYRTRIYARDLPASGVPVSPISRHSCWSFRRRRFQSTTSFPGYCRRIPWSNGKHVVLSFRYILHFSSTSTFRRKSFGILRGRRRNVSKSGIRLKIETSKAPGQMGWVRVGHGSIFCLPIQSNPNQSECSQLVLYYIELVNYVPLTILMLTFNSGKIGIVESS